MYASVENLNHKCQKQYDQLDQQTFHSEMIQLLYLLKEFDFDIYIFFTWNIK